jgi:hypothetical protein
LREDTERLEEEKVTLEGMVESRDELLMEIAMETRLDRMGEDAEDEEEEEDADDGGDAATPPASNYATDHGQHASCSTSSATTVAEGQAWRFSVH